MEKKYIYFGKEERIAAIGCTGNQPGNRSIGEPGSSQEAPFPKGSPFLLDKEIAQRSRGGLILVGCEGGVRFEDKYMSIASFGASQ